MLLPDALIDCLRFTVKSENLNVNAVKGPRRWGEASPLPLPPPIRRRQVSLQARSRLCLSITRSNHHMLRLGAASIGTTLRGLAALSHSFAGGAALEAAAYHTSATA